MECVKKKKKIFFVEHLQSEKNGREIPIAVDVRL